jgi:DNA polymerase III alpha subunit
MNTGLIDLKEYALPSKQPKIVHIYPNLFRKEDLGFDIFDYKFLFADPETARLIREGKTIGCFYIESPGMRNLLKQLKVDTFEMLTAASSIIRPGVAESGMMQEFIARHRDPSKRIYLTPELETVLGDTYGIMIYQEDVIKVAHLIGGLSLEEGDLLRRAMSGKMRSYNGMKPLEDKFYESCRNRKIREHAAKEIWRQIESFVGYAFCKAHSASFALLSYQVAYLKAHYPAEFMASVLSNGGGFYSSAVYIWESKRLGLNVRLPSVNRSRFEYLGYGRNIIIGFMAIKNFTRESADNIVQERERKGLYTSLQDFLVRTTIKYEETAMLIKCGAMDCLGEIRPNLLRLLDIYFARIKNLYESYNDLFADDIIKLTEEVKIKRDYSIEEKCIAEYETFDYMVSRHPLEFFTGLVDYNKIIKAAEMKNNNGRKVRMFGWYMTSKRISTKKGDVMKFLSLEDLTGTFEAILFPNVYARFAEKTLSMGPYVVEGRVDSKNSNNLIVENLEVLTSKSIKAEFRYDSAEDVYKPNDEGTGESDFLMSSATTEKMRSAYLGMAS